MHRLPLTLKFGVKIELVVTPGFYIEAFLNSYGHLLLISHYPSIITNQNAGNETFTEGSGNTC